MSTRDESRLSARERAAFADLESAVAAEDPQFASRLKVTGGSGAPLLAQRVAERYATALEHGWWGGPLVVVGLVLTVIGVSCGLAVGLIGVVLAAAGLRLVAAAGEARWLEGRKTDTP